MKVNKFLGKKSQIVCVAIYIILVSICFILNSQTVTNFIVESIGGNSKVRWYSYMPRLMRTLILDFTFVFLLLYSRITFTGVRLYWHENYASFKRIFSDKSIFNKKNGIVLITLFAISFLGFLALLRANVSYIDDIRHNVETYYEWGNNKGRWGIAIANLLVQMGYTLGDRSPITQLVAIVFLDASAIILAIVFQRLFKQDKIKILSLIASSIIIFNPYFLQCLSYKYESVGMGISVLLAIFPFLVLDNRKLYFCVSAISIFLMCNFYQSSSGIYILMVIFCGFVKYCFDEKKTVKGAILFYLESAIAFAIGTAVFYVLVLNLAFNDPSTEGTSIAFGFNVIRNICLYIKIIVNDFPIMWKTLIVFLVVASLFVLLSKTKRNKIVTIVLYICFLIVSTILSYGAYIFLVDFGDRPRYLYGFIFFVSILANIAVMSNKVMLSVPSILLAWSFFTYASAYGNALGFDKDYTDFLEREVLSDINEYFPLEEYPELKIHISGNTGKLAPVGYIMSEYPITERMIPTFHYDDTGIVSPYWGGRHLLYYDDTLVRAKDNDMEEDNKILLASRRYYDIYFYEPDIVHIVFKKL